MAQRTMNERKNAKARRAKKKETTTGSDERGSKRESTTVTTSESLGPIERLKRFLTSVVAEFKRVTWPSKPELVAGTVVTLFTLVLFSGYLGLLDALFSRILK